MEKLDYSSVTQDEIDTFFIRLNETIKLEKRISKYSIKGSRNKFDKSYYEMVSDGYMSFVKKQRRKVNKLFPRLVRQYDKYVTDGNVRAVDYITHKLVMSLLFVILTLTQDIELFISLFPFFFIGLILTLVIFYIPIKVKYYRGIMKLLRREQNEEN